MSQGVGFMKINIHFKHLVDSSTIMGSHNCWKFTGMFRFNNS